jgi:hypothetical protein
VRRVRIDDGMSRHEWDRLQAEVVGEWDRLRGDDEVLSDDEYRAEERAWLLAKDREAERENAELRREYEAEIAEAGGPLRERDLEPRPAVPTTAREPGRTLSEQQLRTQAAYADISRRPTSHYSELHGEALSLRGRDKHFKEDAATQVTGKAAHDWLNANDPHLTRDGVAEEIAAAFDAGGLSLDDVRRSAFSNGKPNAAARELRAKVRSALLPIFQADRKRVLLSEVLGCSRTALYGLMGAEKKP